MKMVWKTWRTVGVGSTWVSPQGQLCGKKGPIGRPGSSPFGVLSRGFSPLTRWPLEQGLSPERSAAEGDPCDRAVETER